MSKLTIKLQGENLLEVLSSEQIEDVKTKIGGSLFKDGEEHELLTMVGNFGGLTRSNESGYYSVSFNKGSNLITRYVSRGNMVAQVQAAGKAVKQEPTLVDGKAVEGKGFEFAWGTYSWKVNDGELLLIS